jgi:outer membrane protein assembly factor BamB
MVVRTLQVCFVVIVLAVACDRKSHSIIPREESAAELLPPAWDKIREPQCQADEDCPGTRVCRLLDCVFPPGQVGLDDACERPDDCGPGLSCKRRKCHSVRTAGVQSGINSPGQDWSQHRGLQRNGYSLEKGLSKKWPRNGPPLLWEVPGMGKGHTTPAIAGGRIYVTGLRQRTGYLTALGLDGRTLWRMPYGPEWRRDWAGSRCTPTVRDGRVFVNSGMGTAASFTATTGKELWRVDLYARFGGRPPPHGYADSPLVFDNRMIVTPDADRAFMAALDITTGETLWVLEKGPGKTGYASPALMELPNRRLIVTMTNECVAGIDADDGTLLWCDRYQDYHSGPGRLHSDYPNTPLVHGQSVFTSSGYDEGGARLDLEADGTIQNRRWYARAFDVQHGGFVLAEGLLFGSGMSDDEEGGEWFGLDWDSGEVLYRSTWHRDRGSIIYADGMLIVYAENEGRVALVPASDVGFRPVSEFRIPVSDKGRDHWAHPAISDRVLYIRHYDILRAYDVSGEALL